MNIPNNLGKCIVLASIMFWIIVSSEESSEPIFFFVVLSSIPIALVVSATILFTVCPFFWNGRHKNRTNVEIFKMYFPYYSIAIFSLCTIGIISSDFNIYETAFYVSAFFTTNFSWIWFAKEPLTYTYTQNSTTNEIQNKENIKNNPVSR